MTRVSDFFSLVKTFFQNIFSARLSFEQQFRLFILKAFETLFKVYVKRIDDNFFHSNERKEKFKSKGFVKRTVTTAFGYVTFKRRKYVNKKTSQYYYIDDRIGLKRYRRLSCDLIFTILFEYQYSTAAFLAQTYGVSRATVYNLVNSFEMPKLDIQRFKKDTDSPVYMEIDEDHMKCRRSKNTYMRLVVIHRGISEICNDRNRLIDKHTVMFPASVPLEDVSEYVLNYLEKRYDMDKKKLIVNSDGGIWINNFVEKLSIYKPIHIYDKFHLVKSIGEISKRDKEISKNLYVWLEEGNLAELENFYEVMKAREDVSQRRKDLIKMILNQYDKIRRIYTEKDYIGSRTEALVSHECSRFFSSRPKAFSKRKIKARGLYQTFFSNYGKTREKAYELYFGDERTSSIEKVIEMDCLADIVNEIGKTTNIPYLRQGESPMREVLKEISQSKIF